MFTKLKIKILNILLSKLFNAVNESDVLDYNHKKKTMVIGGRPVTVKHLEGLKSDARTILELELWKQLTKDMKYIANKKMYISSTSANDMIFGKAVLYTLEVMDKKMRNILKL